MKKTLDQLLVVKNNTGLTSYNVFTGKKFLEQFPSHLAPSLTAVSCNRVGYLLSFLPTYKWSLTNITKNTYIH
mgnify:CR=1 FL=1